jgi:hypothetical protein
LKVTKKPNLETHVIIHLTTDHGSIHFIAFSISHFLAALSEKIIFQVSFSTFKTATLTFFQTISFNLVKIFQESEFSTLG